MSALALTMLDETGSTNDDARSLAYEGAPHGSAVAALVQTAGRGRRGHGWVSPRGNLYLSVLLRPEVPMQLYMGLSAVCSLGVLRALRDDLGVWGAALKWPNDVMLDGGKLAGILVEAGSSPTGLYAVCGVGLNVEPLAEEFQASFDSPHALPRAFLAQALGEKALDMEATARMLQRRIVETVDAWAEAVGNGRAIAGPLAPVLDEYADVLTMLGEPVAVLDPAGVTVDVGTFAGIDCWGRATVRAVDGREMEFSARNGVFCRAGLAQASWRRHSPVRRCGGVRGRRRRRKGTIDVRRTVLAFL